MYRLLLILLMSMVSFLSFAESASDWEKIYKNPKCQLDGGIYIWDSKRCLLSNDQLIIDGKSYHIEDLGYNGFTSIKKQKEDAYSVGDIEIQKYSGNGFTLKLTKTILSECSGQCTYFHFKADFELIYTDGSKAPLKYQGVGENGA